MNYTTWMAETKRGITTPRSTQLKAVDNAFSTCKDTATGSLPQRKALVDALVAWIGFKGGNWRQSTRNATVDGTGKGTVERLLRDLSADSTFKGKLNQYLTAGVAPVVRSNAYIPGKWDTAKDEDGHCYEFIRQQKGNSCVCATIVMVKRAFHNLSASQLGEEQIRGLMALEETGNLNKGISAISQPAQNHHDWDNVGTGPTRAVNVLKVNPYPVKNARRMAEKSGQTLLDALRKCSRKQPGLVGWRWSAGGGHFTMCCGPTEDGSKLVIVDPWTGIGYVDNTVNGFTSYQNGTGTLGDAIVCYAP
jgi:hypothetical protein